MKLVPCRWSRTGWKYVEADTSAHKFFTNQNRNNCHGYNSPGMPSRGRAKDIMQHNSSTKDNTSDQFMTTNRAFFSHER